MADAVEKLGFFGGLLVIQKIDLHNRSVLNDCILGSIKPTPKIGQKNQFSSFSTASAKRGRWRNVQDVG